MKKKVLLIAIIFLAALILLMISIGFVKAEDLTDLQNKKEELQNQIDESNQQIEEIQIELTQNLEQLNNLNLNIYTYEQEIYSLEENLNELSKQIEKIEIKLTSIEESYNLQQKVLQNRVVALYEAGEIVYLDVLMKANSVTEFISNYFLVAEIIEYDTELLEDINDQKSKIKLIRNTLQIKKEEIQKIKNNKEKTVIALENSKIIRNSYINKLTEQEKQTQTKIDEYQAELNRIEMQIVALTTGNIGSDYIGGEFAWPAPGYTTITSKYGIRIHPILKVTRVHTGTDIAMPTGAYIIAANDGVVIKSMYSTSGYGNMVLIDHGGGVTTLYGHGSQLIAQTGQTVKKGDIIMKAGSTRMVNRTTFTF